MKNELQTLQENVPELIRIQRNGISVKDATVEDLGDLSLRIFRILGLVEKEPEEMQLREEIAIEAFVAMKVKFKSFKTEEVIKAFQLACMGELGLKDKVRAFNANSVGDVLNAYRKYRSEQTKLFRRKEQEFEALEQAKKALPPVLKSIKEIAEEVKSEYLNSGKMQNQFFVYWGKIWFYFYEMPPEESIPFMEQYRKKAELIVKSERVGTLSRKMEISDREIKIKMAELSLKELWKHFGEDGKKH